MLLMLLVTSAIFGMSRARGSKQDQYLKNDILPLPTGGYKLTSFKIKNGITIPTNGYIITNISILFYKIANKHIYIIKTIYLYLTLPFLEIMHPYFNLLYI